MTSEVAELWAAHYQAPLPPGWRRGSVAGVEMLMLDADIAGCVDSWLRADGALDERRQAILRGRRAQLDRVLPELDGAEAAYAERLSRLAALIA